MPYQANVWKDGPDGRTPHTAANHTKIEDGVASAQAETLQLLPLAHPWRASTTPTSQS